MFEYAKEDSKIDFFPRNVLWTFLWDLLPRNVNTWKSLKSIFSKYYVRYAFSCPRSATANWVLEDGLILGSHPVKTCHAWAAPRMKYQLYLPKATLEAVSDRNVKKEKNCSTLQGLKSMVYFRHLKVAKKSIFFRGWRNVTGQNPYPQTSKGRFLGKIDLWVFPNIKCKAK